MNRKWPMVLGLMGLTLAIQGKVLSFNGKWVQIQSEGGRKQYVPRTSIVGKEALQEDAVVTARISMDELGSLVESWPGAKTHFEDPAAKPKTAR